MPVTCQIDPARNLIRTQCIGDVNPEEIAEHFRQLANDPGRPDRLNVLLDLQQETSLPETSQLREVRGDLDQHDLRFGACAIVTCNDALFGMMRIFEVLAAKYFAVTRVFRKIPDAEAWLDTYSNAR
jgi:hypothetical protein